MTYVVLDLNKVYNKPESVRGFSNWNKLTMEKKINPRHKKPRSSEAENEAKHSMFFGLKKAAVAGLMVGTIALGGQWLIGQIYSGYKARELLEAMAYSSRYLASAIVTASATIIALMLTMVSLSNQSESEFDSLFYKRIQRIGLLSAIVLVAGILLLLFLSMPLQESENIPVWYFTTLYYILIAFASTISGLLVTIVLMLLNAINSLIEVISPDSDKDAEDLDEPRSVG